MMDVLHRMFLEEQSTLIEEFDSEKTMLIRKHEEDVTRLQDIMYAMDQNFMEKEMEMKADFQSTRDEIKNRVIALNYDIGSLALIPLVQLLNPERYLLWG